MSWPANPREEFAERVAERLKARGVWAEAIADQVDGDLSTVIEAVLAEVRLSKLERAFYSVIDRSQAHEHVAGWGCRCTYCGHRVGHNVIETRRRPWRIPSELVRRFQAMGAPR